MSHECAQNMQGETCYYRIVNLGMRLMNFTKIIINKTCSRNPDNEINFIVLI